MARGIDKEHQLRKFVFEFTVKVKVEMSGGTQEEAEEKAWDEMWYMLSKERYDNIDIHWEEEGWEGQSNA
jgi:hypothetical protein